MRSHVFVLLGEVAAGRSIPKVTRFGHDRGQVRDILAIDRVDPFFELIMNEGRLVALARQLLGSAAARPLWIHFRNSVPGFEGLRAHRDSYGCFHDPDTCLSTWIALGRYGVRDGCLFYVAGSHRSDIGTNATCSPAGEEWRVAMPVEPGDVLCHGWRTLHGSLPNRSCHQRFALMVCYQSA
jgi:ectoine hydroxylase-related dioxygenase (phytanoyl-CoA dioxygenase family)